MKLEGTLIEKIGRRARSLIPLKFRTLNKEFCRYISLLKENERKSYDEMKEFQFKQLKKQVLNAYQFSKFYKKKFDDFGFHPKDLKNLDDLDKIPLLSKDEIRKNANLIILNNFKDKLYRGYTSGTTGKPLELFYDNKTEAREWASICYQWERIGYKPIDGRVEFRGFIDKDVDYIFYPDHRVLRINIIKMSEKNIKSILKKIKSTKYQFFHGYPSAIYKFSKILETNNININPKGIMLASEVLYDWQMEVIDKIFPFTKKIIHYGQAERLVLGAWDLERKYSFLPTYGLLEINSDNDEIIGTGFINEIMPLIRYELTDSIEGFQEKPIDPNKTLFPVIKTIIGRLEDYTYNTDGEMIPPAIVTFPFKKLSEIKACKIIQKKLDRFDLIFEAEENVKALAEADKIIIDLKKIYGSEIHIDLQFIEKIPVDKSGKFRWIECKIKG